ncbi:MAG: UDP-N-acetylglucosamine--N-acetylmuramyl-(pentapeptide) pyrophosphoryl-undecaprenol N-acetylglucosamine transferase [Alphaproteobacteria bacterium]|jgi:UDP-N-acetylglucosamine--N-acetylmuramyl-(pentapeptide) pyrophosphoryl-undecaprenol N-acetylglucosamine transferase
MSKRTKLAIIAAGASGGHIFPALAVANELKKQGFRCIFVGRGGAFSRIVKEDGFEIKELPASAWNVKNPVRKLMAIFNLMRAFIQAFKLIHHEKASVVFGTGGYATVAAVLAAKLSGVPTVIQEQNVLPGRANRFLSKWADRVCLSFESSRHYLRYREDVMVVTGNPIREKIIKVRDKKRHNDGKFRILIAGGSQGARILSDVVPHAVNLLPQAIKKQIEIIQQTRAEDKQRVIDLYHKFDVPAQVAIFFDDLENQMLRSNLVIARSGASTVNETSLLGRAAIYVPLKLADGHQIQNARAMESLGAAIVMEQACFTAEKLAEKLTELIEDKAFLAKMEKSAYDSAKVDAAKNVAAEVIKLSEEDLLHLGEEFK